MRARSDFQRAVPRGRSRQLRVLKSFVCLNFAPCHIHVNAYAGPAAEGAFDGGYVRNVFVDRPPTYLQFESIVSFTLQHLFRFGDVDFGVAACERPCDRQTIPQAPADQLRHRQADALAPGVEERCFDCTLCEVVALNGFADRVHRLRYASGIGGFQNRCDVPVDGKLHTLGTFGPVREATDGRAFTKARYAVRADDFDDHQCLRLHGRDGQQMRANNRQIDDVRFDGLNPQCRGAET